MWIADIILLRLDSKNHDDGVVVFILEIHVALERDFLRYLR
jgi:hypothetical protein